jgi:hypothetical protein
VKFGRCAESWLSGFIREGSTVASDTKTDTKGAGPGWRMQAYVSVCWLDSKFAVSILSGIAATISVLVAQRFGEGFGVQDSVGTIPTLASNIQRFALNELGGIARRLSAKTSAKLLTLGRPRTSTLPAL